MVVLPNTKVSDRRRERKFGTRGQILYPASQSAADQHEIITLSANAARRSKHRPFWCDEPNNGRVAQSQRWTKREIVDPKVVSKFEGNSMFEHCCGRGRPRSGVWATRPNRAPYCKQVVVWFWTL